jgi:hypothetical protein
VPTENMQMGMRPASMALPTRSLFNRDLAGKRIGGLYYRGINYIFRTAYTCFCRVRSKLPLEESRSLRISAFRSSRSSLQSQILTNEGDGHAAFARSTRYSFDGIVACVAGAEDAWQARLQRERVAIEFPGSKVASCA